MEDNREYAGWWTMDEKVSWSRTPNETYVSSDTINNAEEPNDPCLDSDNDEYMSDSYLMYLTGLLNDKIYGKFLRSAVYKDINVFKQEGLEVPEYLKKMVYLINKLDNKIDLKYDEYGE